MGDFLLVELPVLPKLLGRGPQNRSHHGLCSFQTEFGDQLFVLSRVCFIRQTCIRPLDDSVQDSSPYKMHMKQAYVNPLKSEKRRQSKKKSRLLKKIHEEKQQTKGGDGDNRSAQYSEEESSAASDSEGSVASIEKLEQKTSELVANLQDFISNI